MSGVWGGGGGGGWGTNGRISCGSPRSVALGIFGALTKLKSAANNLPYTSQVALGLCGQCNAQASKAAHCRFNIEDFSCLSCVYNVM